MQNLSNDISTGIFPKSVATFGTVWPNSGFFVHNIKIIRQSYVNKDFLAGIDDNSRDVLIELKKNKQNIKEKLRKKNKYSHITNC